MKQSPSMGAEWLIQRTIPQAVTLWQSIFGALNFLKCASIALLRKRRSEKTLHAKAKATGEWHCTWLFANGLIVHDEDRQDI